MKNNLNDCYLMPEGNALNFEENHELESENIVVGCCRSHLPYRPGFSNSPFNKRIFEEQLQSSHIFPRFSLFVFKKKGP